LPEGPVVSSRKRILRIMMLLPPLIDTLYPVTVMLLVVLLRVVLLGMTSVDVILMVPATSNTMLRPLGAEGSAQGAGAGIIEVGDMYNGGASGGGSSVSLAEAIKHSAWR